MTMFYQVFALRKNKNASQYKEHPEEPETKYQFGGMSDEDAGVFHEIGGTYDTEDEAANCPRVAAWKEKRELKGMTPWERLCKFQDDHIENSVLVDVRRFVGGSVRIQITHNHPDWPELIEQTCTDLECAARAIWPAVSDL